MTKSVSISDYWYGWCASVVSSGIRSSKAKIIEECLGARREKYETEMSDWKEFKEVKKP